MNRSTELRPKITNPISRFYDSLKEKTDFPVGYVLGSLGLATILVFFGVLDLHLTNILSVIFPAYWTMRALEKEDKEGEKQWIIYWFIWAFLFVFDLLIPFFMRKIPYYYFAKILFLTWLFLPNTKGATFLYNNVFINAGPLDFTKLTRYTDRFNLMMKKILDSFFHPSMSEGKMKYGNQAGKDIPEKIKSEPKIISEGEIRKLQEVGENFNQAFENIREIRENVDDTQKGQKIIIDEKYGVQEDTLGILEKEFVEERIITPHSDIIIKHKDKVKDLSHQNLKEKENPPMSQEETGLYERKVQ
jgi:hypothetical protein